MVFSNPSESLNTMKDIKVTNLDNFIINSVINSLLLIKLSMFKVFFFSSVLELKLF